MEFFSLLKKYTFPNVSFKELITFKIFILKNKKELSHLINLFLQNKKKKIKLIMKNFNFLNFKFMYHKKYFREIITIF